MAVAYASSRVPTAVITAAATMTPGSSVDPDHATFNGVEARGVEGTGQAAEHGHATEIGRRDQVDAPLVRVRHHARVNGDPAEQGGQDESRYEGDAENDQVRPDLAQALALSSG